MKKNIYCTQYNIIISLFLCSMQPLLHAAHKKILPNNKQNQSSLIQILSQVANTQPSNPSKEESIEMLPTNTLCETSPSVDSSQKEYDYEWNIMLYIQAKNNLYHAAIENLHQIAQTIKSKNIAIYVQWYQPNHEGIKRYSITQNKINLEYNIDNYCNNHTSNELVNFVEWATSKAPAKKYAIILWNHGLGVIDPEWGNGMRIIQNPLEMAQGNRIQIEDVIDVMHFDTFSDNNRGILFDETRRLYMTNKELIKSFQLIQKDIFKGKKIDIIGMDACYMQMLEVLDMLSPFGNICTASEDVELAQGLNYPGLMKCLNDHPDCSPLQFAQYIIQTYDALYRGRTNLFTQSALHLSEITTIKNNLNAVAKGLLYSYNIAPHDTKNLIRQARSRCQQFSMQTYIDLKSFYEELQRGLKPINEGFIKLEPLLKEAIQSINTAVIANTSSTYFNKAYGISIYFPLYRIDKSYLDTPFASDTAWVELLYKSLLI